MEGCGWPTWAAAAASDRALRLGEQRSAANDLAWVPRAPMLAQCIQPGPWGAARWLGRGGVRWLLNGKTSRLCICNIWRGDQALAPSSRRALPGWGGLL